MEKRRSNPWIDGWTIRCMHWVAFLLESSLGRDKDGEEIFSHFDTILAAWEILAWSEDVYERHRGMAMRCARYRTTTCVCRLHLHGGRHR